MSNAELIKELRALPRTEMIRVEYVPFPGGPVQSVWHSPAWLLADDLEWGDYIRPMLMAELERALARFDP